jgi:hypothetical protein
MASPSVLETKDQAEALTNRRGLGQSVRLEGFEPPTLGSVDRCSNPLSYSRDDEDPQS